MNVEASHIAKEPKRPPAALRVEAGRPLIGEIGREGGLALPGDKSLSHRAALFSALAEGESSIGNFLVSGVTRPMLAALSALGIPWQLEDGTLRVWGCGLNGLMTSSSSPPINLDCGNSATTLRLLAGALAAWNGAARLDGSPGLRRRPMERIVQPLQEMGVAIQSTEGHVPLLIQPSPRPLRPLHYTLPVASAQVKSCLLLAALAADGETTLIEPGPSRDHTERLLRAMGVPVDERPLSSGGSTTGSRLISLRPPIGNRLRPLQVYLPGDLSAAAFLIVAALIVPSSHLVIYNVGLNPTRCGLLDALREMGGDIQATPLGEQGGEPWGSVTVRYSPLHGIRLGGEQVVRMIDEFPIFAIAAACAQGETQVRDAQELRYKESDRITDLGHELRVLGVDFEEHPDGFTVHGGHPLRGGVVEAHGDHRLAMALAIAGLAAKGTITVNGAEMIDESFPAFVPLLQHLGAHVHLITEQ